MTILASERDVKLDQFKSELPVELIVDADVQSGRFNMAMDEALLELGAAKDACVCRIYLWSEPTVTLGYFQAKQEEQISPFPDLPVVRRLSGGGAILHDQEMTYSCVLPAEHPVRHDPSQLYVMIHQGLIRLMADCGVLSCLRSDFLARVTTSTGAGDSQPAAQPAEDFLCFLRQNPNDIVDSQSGIKIVGSAQRRRRGVILQHGSILLNASPIAPNIKGVLDLSSRFDLQRFRKELPIAIASSFGVPGIARTYSEEERAISAGIESQMSMQTTVANV